MCSLRMLRTSPGLCPSSKIIFNALLSTNPAESNTAQNNGISLALRTRSRLVVAFLSTPTHGFMLIPANSSLIAHVKIALADAKTWLAMIGTAMLATMAFTSDRVTSMARNLAQRGSKYFRTSASACFQLLFFRAAYLR